jgi:hypothetical protein
MNSFHSCVCARTCTHGSDAQVSIPVLHSSACLIKLCTLNYSGATSIFMRILLDKR